MLKETLMISQIRLYTQQGRLRFYKRPDCVLSINVTRSACSPFRKWFQPRQAQSRRRYMRAFRLPGPHQVPKQSKNMLSIAHNASSIGITFNATSIILYARLLTLATVTVSSSTCKITSCRGRGLCALDALFAF